MIGIIPPFLMRGFGEAAGSPLLILLNTLAGIHQYTKEHFDANETTRMWSDLHTITLQRLWLAEKEENGAADNNDSHFYLVAPLPVTKNVRALEDGAALEKKYRIQHKPPDKNGNQLNYFREAISAQRQLR